MQKETALQAEHFQDISSQHCIAVHRDPEQDYRKIVTHLECI